MSWALDEDVPDVLFRGAAGACRRIGLSALEEIRRVPSMACDGPDELSVQLPVPPGVAMKRVEFEAWGVTCSAKPMHEIIYIIRGINAPPLARRQQSRYLTLRRSNHQLA